MYYLWADGRAEGDANIQLSHAIGQHKKYESISRQVSRQHKEVWKYKDSKTNLGSDPCLGEVQIHFLTPRIKEFPEGLSSFLLCHTTCCMRCSTLWSPTLSLQPFKISPNYNGFPIPSPPWITGFSHRKDSCDLLWSDLQQRPFVCLRHRPPAQSREPQGVGHLLFSLPLLCFPGISHKQPQLPTEAPALAHAKAPRCLLSTFHGRHSREAKPTSCGRKTIPHSQRHAPGLLHQGALELPAVK